MRPSRFTFGIMLCLTITASLTALLCNHFWLPVEASEAGPAWDRLRIDYTLRIPDPTSGEAIVTMLVSGITSNTLEVEEHGYHGLYVRVSGLAARNTAGGALDVQHLPDSGTSYFGQNADVWRVHTAGLPAVVIEYRVRPGMEDASHGYRGYIGTNFAMLAGEYVFLAPRGATLASAKVAFSIPAGWQVYAPWPKEDGNFNPAVPGITSVLDSLMVSDFALGSFDVYTRTIGTTQVDVAAYSGWPPAVKQSLAEQSWRILAYQTRVFGGSVGTHYLAIFCPPAPDGKQIYAGEWSTGQGYSIRIESDGSYWGNWSMFAHQTFHRWNGWAWGMSGYGSWFSEGPTVFYEGKTTTELGIQRPYGDLEDELLAYYNTYLTDYVATGLDRPVTQAGSDSFLIYRKSAMVTFLLAREVCLMTDCRLTFDDFLRLLFAKYGYYHGSCPEDCLAAELTALTGADFAPFFANYVYGSVQLPMEWASEDDDSDGLSNALEIAWDTHPRAHDTDQDGYPDTVEIGRSDPRDPTSIPHFIYLPSIVRDYSSADHPVSIDGDGSDWGRFPPIAADPQGDTLGGPHTDLKAVYTVMSSRYAFVMVEAYDPPLRSDSTIELNLELRAADGRQRRVHTNVNSNGSFYAWTDDDWDGNWEPLQVPGALVAWRNVMELRLPLEAINRPMDVRPSFVNFWCTVGGQWRWVDMINP